MVVADGQHEVAAGLDQVGVQDGDGGGRAEAVAGPEPLVDLGRFESGVARERSDPQRVDLHRPEVVGAVGVAMHGAQLAALDGLDAGQGARRQAVEARG